MIMVSKIITRLIMYVSLEYQNGRYSGAIANSGKSIILKLKKRIAIKFSSTNAILLAHSLLDCVHSDFSDSFSIWGESKAKQSS